MEPIDMFVIYFTYKFLISSWIVSVVVIMELEPHKCLRNAALLINTWAENVTVFEDSLQRRSLGAYMKCNYWSIQDKISNNRQVHIDRIIFKIANVS